MRLGKYYPLVKLEQIIDILGLFKFISESEISIATSVSKCSFKDINKKVIEKLYKKNIKKLKK